MRFKVTILDPVNVEVISEIVDEAYFPAIGWPVHFFKSGRSGAPIKVELVLAAVNTEDTT